jgi:hypothetical protein
MDTQQVQVKPFVALRFFTNLVSPNLRRAYAVDVLAKQGFTFPLTLTFPHNDPPLVLRIPNDLPTQTVDYGHSTLVEWRTAV